MGASIVRLEVFKNFLDALNYAPVRVLQNSSVFRADMEAAMNHIPIPLFRHQARVREENPMPLRAGLATLRGVIATWDRRARFRRDLKRVSRSDPHLIDDIGLARRQVEIEIAKHLWQA